MMAKNILLVFCLFLLMSCDSKSKKVVAPPLQELEVLKVVSADIVYERDFLAQLYAKNSYVIQPRVSGYVTGKYFEGGEKVSKGKLLYKIDSKPFEASVAQARANLSSAKAQYQSAKNNYERSVPLAKINAISQSSLDEAVATYKSAQESVASAQQALNIELLNLGYTNIYAPESGYVQTSNVVVGDYIGMGTAYSQLTTIYATDSIAAYISMPLTDFMKQTKSSQVSSADTLFSDISMIMPDGSMYPYKGVYMYSEPTVNNMSGSIEMRIMFENAQSVLQPGTFVNIKTNIGAPQKAIMIPQRSASQTQGVYSVFKVLPDSTLKSENITVDYSRDNYYIVSKGLNNNDVILVDGIQKARDGMKIKPIMTNK